ncbi:MAG: pilus assembly protein N-terminal domain-containing protein [Steroidobacteraceae bacterium]
MKRWFAVLLAGASISLASGAEPVPAQVEMFVGDSRVFGVDVQRAAVGNGKVLSVSTPVRGELLLLAEGAGVTTLQLWLPNGERRRVKIVVVEMDLAQRLEQVQRLLDGAPHVRARVAGSRIVLEGEGASDAERSRAAHVAESFPGLVLDFVGKVGWEPMIEVDVRIVEVRQDQLKELGLRWDDSIPGPSVGAAIGEMPLLSPLPPSVTAPAAYFSLATAIGSRINLLERKGLARVLAEPRLTCRSGAVARFVAGGEIPLPVSDGLGSTDVEYKEYGIILEVRPRADDTGSIHAEVTAELSQIDEAVRVQSFPGFLKRTTSTAVNLKAGETLVLAGLLTTETSRDRRGVPGLSRVPLAGGVFRSRQQRERQTELLILLRPRTVQQALPGDSDASSEQQRYIQNAPAATSVRP